MADDNDKKIYISCKNCDVGYWVKWEDDDAEPNTCAFCGFDTSIDEEDFGNINGRLHLPYTSEQQRHDQISNWALSIIDTAIGNIFIEGYSYGSKGLVFNLAENMGTLKHKLYKLNKRFQVIVPGQIKKNATGKGNADKQKMYDQIIADTGINLVNKLDLSKLNNPVTDIVDSYYIAKYGANQ